MKEFLLQLVAALQNAQPVALVSVVEQQGSAPRGAGSKMLVGKGGLMAGSVGGGLAEASAIKTAIEAITSQKSRLLRFTLDGQMAAQSDMICGGNLQIFIDPIQPSAANIHFFNELLQSLDVAGAVVLSQVVQGNTQRHMCIQENHQKILPTPINDLANQAFSCLGPLKESMLLQQDTDSQYSFSVAEFYAAPWSMIIAGGGHISKPTTQLAAMVGFQVSVLDDREEFSQSTRFPQAHSVHTVPDFAHCFIDRVKNVHTCIIIVTRGHMHDAIVLQQALATKAAYIGMIGSKRKKEQVYTALQKQGILAEDLARVHCPIGLDIHAETPEEIAVSIIAECIAFKRTFTQ